MVPAGPLLLYLQRQRNARARDQYSTRFGDNNTWLHVLPRGSLASRRGSRRHPSKVIHAARS